LSNFLPPGAGLSVQNRIAFFSSNAHDSRPKTIL